jgi:hypothetical protein
MFKPTPLVNDDEKFTSYDHGYSPEEVERINQEYEKLKEKVEKENYLLTLEDNEKIIFPHFRISRTEVFNLVEEKARAEKKLPKEPKAPKEKKPAKPKKMTKMEAKERIVELLTSLEAGKMIPPEMEEELNALEKILGKG